MPNDKTHTVVTDSRKIITFFGAIHFLLMGKNALWLYCVIYFRELGFGSQEIGFMNSIGTFVSMALLPVMGIISDRFFSPRTMFLLVGALLIPAYFGVTVLGMTIGAVFIPFALVCLFVTFGQQVTGSMLDSWSGEEMERLHLSYGAVRKFASGGYVFMSVMGSLFLGPLLPSWSAALLMSAMSVGMVLIALMPMGRSMASDFDRAQRVRPKTWELLKLVFRNYRFVTYLFVIVAWAMFQGIINLDMTYLMDHANTAQSNVGLVGGIRAGTEVVVMILMARCKKHPPLWVLLGISSLLVAAEHLGYAYVSSLGGMLAVSLLSGIGGGFFYGFGPNYVFQIVDHRAASTAMAVLGVIKAMISVIFNSLGGGIIAQSGVIALTNLVGILVLVLSVAFFASCILDRLLLQKK